jgi:hypothetical protein
MWRSTGHNVARDRLGWSLLAQSDAEHLALFPLRRLVVGVGFEDEVAPCFLLGQRLDGAGLKVGRDDAVRYDAREHAGQRLVNRLGHGDEVPERRFGIAVPRPDVCRGHRRHIRSVGSP